MVITYLDIFAVGGIETHIRRLLSCLSEKGWCGVVITNASTKNCSQSSKIGNFAVKYIFPIETTTLPWPLHRSLKNTLSTIVRFWVRDLYRYISSLRAIFTSGIRVVYVPGPTHSSSTLLPTFFPFWGLLKLFGIRTVVGIRGPFFAFCSSPNLSDKIFRKIFYLDDVTQQIIADKIIYVDPYLRTLYPNFKKGILIPNSVDTQKFCPNPSTETNTVTYVGRLSPERGVWVFLKAIELIQDNSCSFQIVGVGKLEDQIRKYISEKKINVTLRKASHEEMPTIYNESSIIVNPLIMKGSWIGNITLEAMACGKCLIKSSDYLSKDPIIKNGVNGLLFRLGDFYDLSEQIKYALSSEEFRKAIGKAARDTVTNVFTLNTEIDCYDNLFLSF